MFEYDICLCGNADQCQYKQTCKRAIEHGPGIYTVSLFYDGTDCCNFYYPIKEVDINVKQNGNA